MHDFNALQSVVYLCCVLVAGMMSPFLGYKLRFNPKVIVDVTSGEEAVQIVHGSFNNVTGGASCVF
jgi:hypothetical protein